MNLKLKTAVASIVYKAKGKPRHHHKSYRQVRVTPLIVRCLNEFIRPHLVEITKPIQNSSQYWFTENVTYIMGALQRHEVEKFCVDQKKTFFGCILDGASAFRGRGSGDPDQGAVLCRGEGPVFTLIRYSTWSTVQTWACGSARSMWDQVRVPITAWYCGFYGNKSDRGGLGCRYAILRWCVPLADGLADSHCSRRQWSPGPGCQRPGTGAEKPGFEKRKK